jgi:isopentenyl phosphate kinase
LKIRPIVLKLGGSVITKKDKALTPNLQARTRLAEEISKAEVFPIVLIHGGGSYGHSLARTYNIKEGLKHQSQLIGFSKTHEAMVYLNLLVVEKMLSNNIPALGMLPSSFIITKKGRIQYFSEKPLIDAIKTGFIPVLCGDAVLDIDQGFAILSGDQLAVTIALKLNAKSLILGVDVDGIYNSDPKKNSNAELLSHLTLSELRDLERKITETEVTDVTGGMKGKVSEIFISITHGIDTIIINALKAENVYKALKGEEVLGTKIES